MGFFHNFRLIFYDQTYECIIKNKRFSGLFLFMLEVAILCWVKFWDYSFTAAVAATVIVIPVLITFVLFAAHFYHSLVVDKCNSSVSDMQKLEEMKQNLDEITKINHSQV